jgi:autotransporter-associated beta strand protein
MKPKSNIRRFLILAGSSLLTVSSASAQATSATWDENNAGNWTAVTNWTGNTAYAEGADNTATLGNFISADRVITLDADITIGGISALDTSNNYSISGSNALTLDVTTGQSILNVVSGRALTIGTAVTVNDGIDKQGAGAVSITGAVSLGGVQTWTNNSTGTFTKTNASLITNNGHQLTFDGTGNFTIGTVSSGTAVLTGSGALVKNGTGRLDLGGNNTGFSGTVTINGGVMQVHNVNEPMGTGNLTLNGGVMSWYWGANYTRTLGTSTSQVQILGGESGFGGAGTTGPTVNLGSSVRWGAAGEGAGAISVSDPGATGFFNPSKFVLGDSGTGNAGTITFSSAIDLNATTRTILVPFGLSATGNVSTISGAISTSSGTAGLIKEGAGTLSLSVANSYTGTTTISGGALRLGTATALPGGIGASGGTSNLTMNAGYLEIATGTTFARGLGTGATQFQITGGTSGFSARGGARTVNIGGASGTVTWGDPGFAPSTLVLNGITADNTLNFQNPLALGSTNRTVFTGANTATLSGALTGTNGLTKTGAGALNINGDVSGLSGTVVMTAGTLGRSAGGNLVLPAIEVQSGTLSAPLGGTGTLTKTTAGDVALTGNNSSFSGDVFINAGRITGIGTGTYQGFGTGTVTITGGTLLFNSGAVATMANDYNWNGNFTIDRAPSSIPTITWTGDITLGANVTIAGSAAGGGYTHIFNGPILDDLTGGRSLTFNVNGTGGRTFITLNGNNTFTGNLTLQRGSLTIGGSGKLGGGNYSGNISISALATAPITYSSSSDQILRGNISGVAGLGLTKDTSSTSTLVLSGTNTYTGKTTVSAGTLQFAKRTSLYNNTPASWTAANINVLSGATFALNVDSAGTNGFTDANLNTLLANISVANTATEGLQAGAILGFDTSTAAGGSFTQGNAIADSTGSGAFHGAIGLTKLGTGTLVLDKTNTYTGATTVRGGTLVVGDGVSGSVDSNVTVTTGTLGGTGSISGAVTIGDGTGSADAILAPGTSIESLATGNLAFDIDGSYAVEVDGTSATSDQTLVTGTVSINAAATLAVNVTGTLVDGQKFFIVVNDDVDAVTGTFATLPQGALVGTYGGFDLRISYLGDSVGGTTAGGNDIVLYAETSGAGAPEIAIEQPAATDIPNGGSQGFGTVTLGSNTSLTFTIRNTGSAGLNLTGTPPEYVVVGGTNAADFVVTAQPSTPVTSGGGTTTFTVRFAPLGATAGARNAVLTVANNDSDEGTFTINVSGTAQTPYDAWSGGAGFDVDTNGDGVDNGLAFLLGAANPNANALGLLPEVTEDNGNLVLNFNMLNAAARGTAALSIEHSSDLGIGDAWEAALVPDVDNTINDVVFDIEGSGPLDVEATIPSSKAVAGKLFGRLKATE